MPPTPLATTQRFVPQGTSRYYWVPTIAATTKIPTRAEMDAGTDLTGEVAVVTGFSTTATQVDTPDALNRFVGRVPSSITPDDSSLTFYGSKSGTDVRSFFTRDQTGFLVICDSGDVPGRMAECVPVTVLNISKVRDLTGAFQIVVSFSVTSEPVPFVIPA